MITTLYITRHAQRADNNTIPGQRVLLKTRGEDTDITSLGEVQATETGKALKDSGVSLIYSSPFYRTTKTAVLIARELGVKVRLDWGLSEQFASEWFPEWPGTIPEEILKREFPEIDSSVPTGIYPKLKSEDDFWMMFHRINRATQILFKRHEGETIVLVTHGYPMVAAQCGLTGDWVASGSQSWPNCGLSKIVHNSQENKWWAEYYGKTSHLTNPTV